MGRKRHSNTPHHSDERDDNSPSLEKLLRPQIIKKPLPSPYTPSPQKILSNTLRQIEDRRTFHPQAEKRPARSINRAQHKLVLHKPNAPKLSHKVAFSAPKNVLICIRRKRRKEVLFAKKQTRKGAGAKRHRRNYFSEVTC